MLVRLFNALAGSAHAFSIHARILNMTLFVTTFFTALLSAQSVVEGLDPMLSIIVGSLSVVFACLYFFARVRGYNRIVTPIFIAIGLISISGLYFLSDGINGDVPPYFVFSCILGVSLVKRKYYPYIIAINALSFVACYMLETTFPEAITSYATDELRHRQILYATTALTIFSGAAFALFKNNYDGERQIVRKQNLELQRTHQNLIRAKNEAEKAGQAKSEFLSTMSHEIRTPLNAVIGMSYILQEEDPRPDQLENLNILKFSAENLLSLINDVLDYSKIEAGKVVFEEAEFHLDELLHSLEQAHSLKAEEKGVRLSLKRAESVPQVLIGDSTRVTQILNNLLSNAVKFTEDGSVDLNITLKDRHQDQVRVIFTVVDSGIGIAEERQGDIFEIFTQEDNSTTRKFGGTGLGLAITRQLVELMDGKISLQSEQGNGSTFRVELPLKVGRAFESSANQESTEEKPLAGKYILLAEDNPVNVIVAEKILSKWGAEINVAKNGAEAVTSWEERKPDVVLMDLRMPEMSGIEATAIIRERESGAGLRTPIIALTASAMLDEQNEIFTVGMDEYVSKPFNPAELLGKINKHL